MNPDEAVVLDASAVLAGVRGETGGDAAIELFPYGLISAVNWSEVVRRAQDITADPGRALADIRALGLRIVPFEAADAERAASLWPLTRARGLSLADRACLALGLARGIPVVTADRAWAELGLDLEVVVLR